MQFPGRLFMVSWLRWANINHTNSRLAANIGTDLVPGTITLGEDGVEDVCQFNVHDGAKHTFLDDDTIFGFFTDGAALS